MKKQKPRTIRFEFKLYPSEMKQLETLALHYKVPAAYIIRDMLRNSYEALERSKKPYATWTDKEKKASDAFIDGTGVTLESKP